MAARGETKLRFLLANDLEGLNRLHAILAGFEFQSTSTLDHALELLDSDLNFDLIVVGVHFDDSRAIDLLRETRAREQYASTPFLFIRTRPSSLSQVIEQSILALKGAFRVSGFIETDMFLDDDRAVRQAIFDTVAKSE